MSKPSRRQVAYPARLGALLCVITLALGGCATYSPAPLGNGQGSRDLAALSVPASAMPTRDLAAHRFDPTDGLDATEVAMLAVVNNPDLKVKRDELGVARAQAFAAGLLPDPQLSLSSDFPSSSGVGLGSAFNLGLSYDLGALLTHSARKSAANNAREQVRLDLLWAEWQTVAQARLLFGQVLLARRQEALLTVEVTALAPLDREVQAALAAGNLTFDGASAGLNAMADVRRRLSESTRQRQLAEHDLRLLLGLAPPIALNLVGSAYQVASSPAQVQAALATLPERRPDLLALKAGYASQEEHLRAAILAQFPAINLGITRARDTSGVYTSGFTIGMTLPLFDRNRGNIAIEKASRQRLRDDYDARLLTARSDMQQLQLDLVSLQAQIEALSAHAQSLDAARAAANQAWQAGQLDWPIYLAIRGNALSADLDLSTLRAEQARQSIALETLLGGDWADQSTNRPAP